MSGTSIFNGTTSCFRLGPLKSGMSWDSESNVIMTRCRLQGGDGKVEMAMWKLESREKLQVGRCWGQGEAAWLEGAGLGRDCQFGGGCRLRGKDDEVEIVRWRWQGGRNHRIMSEEWRHPGSVKIYGKTMSLLIGPDTTFIRKGSVFGNRAGHYI